MINSNSSHMMDSLHQQQGGNFATGAGAGGAGGGGGGDGGELLMMEESMSSLTSASATPTAAAKRKRGLPGTPDPDAEVIALSPRTLMATNRFVCEVCNKGFQRDQNLQLHRRGHNLPWKLKQRANKDGAVRKKVYICPEVTCVHHEPSRALGDLTGIKKHYFRKHGEKRWKCDKCSKKYAVHSDWKAHIKVCGTREYRCDCGTVFSRRDSFITHRAFCDALTEETAKAVSVSSLSIHNPGIYQTQDHSSLAAVHVPRIDEKLQELPMEDQPKQHPQKGQSSFFKPELHPWAQYNTDVLPLVDPYAVPAASSTSLAPLSATALLQKAAQMGASTSQGYGQMAPHDNASRALHPAMSYGMSSAAMSVLDGSGCSVGGEGLTRDFLGLRALSHGEMMTLAGLEAACIDPSPDGYLHTQQQRDKQPWDE